MHFSAEDKARRVELIARAKEQVKLDAKAGKVRSYPTENPHTVMHAAAHCRRTRQHPVNRFTLHPVNRFTLLE